MAESARDNLDAEVSPNSADSLQPPAQEQGITDKSVAESGNQKHVTTVSGSPSQEPLAQPLRDLEAATLEPEMMLKLLEKPPGEVAGWAIEQVRDLSDAETLVESTQIFKLASAMREAPINQKEALVTSLLQGVGDLPVQERAEAVRLFSQMSAATHEDVQAASSNAEPSVASLLNANFSRIAKESAIAEMPPEELRGLTDTVQKESQGLVQPLIDVVPELSEEERKRVTETLVSKGLVSEENRVMLEDTMKPGGHADQLASFIWCLQAAYRYSWLVWAVPLVEGVMIAIPMECSLPAFTWLLVDLVLGSIVAIAAGAARHIFKATYKEFCDDALGTIRRLQAAHAEGKLGEVIPGVKLAAVAIGICLLCMVLGAFWACIGIYFIAGTVWTSCPAAPRLSYVIVCSGIASFRFGLVVALVVGSLKGYRKIQQLKNHSTEPLLSDSEQSYGTLEAQS